MRNSGFYAFEDCCGDGGDNGGDNPTERSRAADTSVLGCVRSRRGRKSLGKRKYRTGVRSKVRNGSSLTAESGQVHCYSIASLSTSPTGRKGAWTQMSPLAEGGRTDMAPSPRGRVGGARMVTGLEKGRLLWTP